jgi:hypothetical protein
VIVFRSILVRASDPFLAQGRRLFTVIIPISMLTLLGLKQLFRPNYYRVVGIVGFSGLFIMDTIVLLYYLLLNFYEITLF